MAVVYANGDGYVTHYGTTWADARGNTPGNSATSASSAYAVRIDLTTGRGGTTYGIARSFMSFDVGGITHIPSKVILYIQGQTLTSSDLIIVGADYSVPVAAADFENITGASTPLAATDGSAAGTFVGTDVVAYTDEISSWGTGVNAIVLNEAARSAIAFTSNFQICIMNYDYDYKDIVPPTSLPPFSSVRSGIKFSSSSGTTRDPYLDIFDRGQAIFMGANF